MGLVGAFGIFFFFSVLYKGTHPMCKCYGAYPIQMLCTPKITDFKLLFFTFGVCNIWIGYGFSNLFRVDIYLINALFCPDKCYLFLNNSEQFEGFGQTLVLVLQLLWLQLQTYNLNFKSQDILSLSFSISFPLSLSLLLFHSLSFQLFF